MWSIEKWVELAKALQNMNYTVLLLGGAQEHDRNLQIQSGSGATYLGHFPLKQFVNLIDQCDLVVTQVTMGMHLTLGLQKKIVLMNNIFNPHEFHLYSNGVLVGPDTECVCYYGNSCVKGTSCMKDLPVEKVLSAVVRPA